MTRRKNVKKPKSTTTNEKVLSYSERLQRSIREQNLVKISPKTYQYYTRAFHYFHKINGKLEPNRTYRKQFWTTIANGTYAYSIAKEFIDGYKAFLENKMKEIIEGYSIVYWMHISRRISPSVIGDDKRSETIKICRNIIIAAIQKFGQLEPCKNICLSTEIEASKIFKGLFLLPEFSKELEIYPQIPVQPVLANFDQNDLLKYYELERLAFEMWYIGSKARIISKGAELVVLHDHEQIILDNRSLILQKLIMNYDNRQHSMLATATGTIFSKSEDIEFGNVYLTQLETERDGETFSDPISEYLELTFMRNNFPNYHFVNFNLRGYLKVHRFYAEEFEKKWATKLEFVITVIADICLFVIIEMIIKKNISYVVNLYLRSYSLKDLIQFKNQIKDNWSFTIKFLDIQLEYSSDEVDKAVDFLSLTEKNKLEIHLDSFGPLKLITPSYDPKLVTVDLSLLGEILYNLFYGLPLLDKGDKGILLEKAIIKEESYLPTTPSKALDGSSKQVDYSIARGEMLILVECKAVARSFGIFGGDPKALEHRFKNVIEKGLNDVDKKIQWFLKNPKGTNYDITKFKYIVGVAVSSFCEFIPSDKEKYWLNSHLPRVLTVDEFDRFQSSDVEKTITKNRIPIV